MAHASSSTGSTPASHPGEALQKFAAQRLQEIDAKVTGKWARPITWRQPTHTVYVPAHLFSADVPSSWGQQALDCANAQGGVEAVARALGYEAAAAEGIAQRVEQKLRTQPIEDLRIDFEDGFTQRGVAIADRDADEDARVLEAAHTISQWVLHPNAQSTPSFFGIRFKSFDPLFRDRGLRTLAIFLDAVHETGALAALFGNAATDQVDRVRTLRLTFPKVQHPEQVRVLCDILEQLEEQYGLAKGVIPFEIQVETPQAIMGEDGENIAAGLIEAAQGRCISMHYGTYDYSASMGIDAAHQSMEHPVADYAKDTLQVATAAVGVELSDGSTNQIPVGTPEQIQAGWELHHRLVTRHLNRGIRQGWDLHPHQLLTRHIATAAYFRAHWELTAQRLHAYLAGDTSRWMDEPATAKAMAGYLLRAMYCGAIGEDALEITGASLEQLQQLQRTGRLAG